MPDEIWDMEKIKKGKYTEEIDNAFNSLSKNDFKKFCEILINVVDFGIKYGWQHKSFLERFDAKLQCYNVSVKLKRKTKKQILIEKVARSV